MKKLFRREARENSIYKNKPRLKLLILAISIVIGLGSIFYTNDLVTELKEREQRFITLFAKTMEYTANQDQTENLSLIFEEIVVNNYTIPVILLNEEEQPVYWRNIDIPEKASEERQQRIIRRELEVMREEHEPIVVRLRNADGEIYDYQYVYYRNSELLMQLRYYPYVQLSVIAVFAALVYLAFSYSRTAEQNRVWAGLAKETAHQLGTPLSSLMAWVEYLKTDPNMQQEVLVELDKDIHKLELITNRFSNIGSVPVLKIENLSEIIQGTLNYLQPRLSSKVKLQLHANEENITARINKPLFDWVIENLCKNAVDAMKGSGNIDIFIEKSQNGKVFIDIQDTGSGIAKNKIKEVFNPGFTTKKRGWGLGLTLVKRIIENYHEGKIMVKASEIGVGTTFRIVLKR
jgi:two-component system, sporulation sensor kinase E